MARIGLVILAGVVVCFVAWLLLELVAPTPAPRKQQNPSEWERAGGAAAVAAGVYLGGSQGGQAALGLADSVGWVKS